MSTRGIPKVGLSSSYHLPRPPVSATIEVVSPEVSSVPDVRSVPPPPDRIEQLFRELDAKIREYRPRDDLASLEKAFRTAAEFHKGQLRDSGEPFMVHPLMVAHILAGMRMDLVTIETVLLHEGPPGRCGLQRRLKNADSSARPDLSYA